MQNWPLTKAHLCIIIHLVHKIPKEETMMKKLFALLLALTLALTAISALAEDAKPLAGKNLKIALSPDFMYFETVSETDETGYEGLDIDIIKKLSEKLGFTFEIVPMGFSSLIGSLQTGDADFVISGMSYTEERAKKYTFSDPYVYTHKVLVVSADNEDIKSVEDLAGRTSANSASSTYAALAEQYGATVTYVDTLGETMAMLEQGRVDATINAKGSVEDYLGEHPDANVKIVLTVPGDPVCYPMKKGAESDTLVAAVNEALAQAREDGTLAALSEKYFGADLTNPQ